MYKNLLPFGKREEIRANDGCGVQRKFAIDSSLKVQIVDLKDMSIMYDLRYRFLENCILVKRAILQ
jgi:hypothetical protein